MKAVKVTTDTAVSMDKELLYFAIEFSMSVVFNLIYPFGLSLIIAQSLIPALGRTYSSIISNPKC